MVATRKFLHNKKILLLVKVIAFLNLENTFNYYIKTRDPSLNRTDSAPKCSKLWDPIIFQIACTIKPRPADISFPKK